MQELEISGKSVEQAIKKALDKLDVTRDQVDVIILSEGKPGILGLGAEEARIRVRTLVATDSKESALAREAKEVLETLLQMMEHAGTELALTALDMLGPDWREKRILVLAGTGGNGGGGITAARHLANRGAHVTLVSIGRPSEADGALGQQFLQC